MFSSLWIAKTGLDAQQTEMDVISNNLANASTTGFKASRASFQDLMYQNEGQPGSQTTQQTQAPSGLLLGTGVKVVGSEKLFTQGAVTQTGNPLDVAIQGNGFIQVSLPDGTVAYTRDGSLHQDSTGQLVTADGYPLVPSITLPNNVNSITIGTDGTVSATSNGSTKATQLGVIQLANFVNPAGLEAMGQNLYLETESSGTAETGQPGINGMGTLAQGSLESSNTNVVAEMVNMIQAQRTYEMNSKSISAVDDMLQFVINKT
ncbi:flagellar basal-body rod protein FlgG [Dyella mobilis]|uniref:Flagellar basal-body rod protein FlgG n=1 Tax=Dyella mobilis TaxID=1849582 RepID=A0ABS2KAA7_9GAMM|nr:flagellar basal-body rod protein FlgG [Dyella mobilis]MBM7128122.1 flagellar basal-body rod protein FlgG [Dyella mobilis]GLQ99938.1 flagellar basal-body rod protein FlgF [Dyella mobilis]